MYATKHVCHSWPQLRRECIEKQKIQIRYETILTFSHAYHYKPDINYFNFIIIRTPQVQFVII